MIAKLKGHYTPIVLYLIGFGIILYYNLSHPVINDGVWEYLAYLENIKHGWQYNATLVNSCLIPTWLPAMIQRLTHWDAMTLFRVYPAFFFPLMPAFIYLISRKYLEHKMAFASAALALCSSYFLFFPDMGRVGIALGFFAVFIWALLNNKLWLSLTFLVLVVLSHYATAFIMIGLVAFLLIANLFRRKLIKVYLVIFILALLAFGIWNLGIAKYSGRTMVNIFVPTYSEDAETQFLENEYKDIIRIDSRSIAVQKAFFTTWGDESAPSRIEIIANWLIVLVISLGLLVMLRSKQDAQLKLACVAFYLLVCGVVFIPKLSIYYGVLRVLFTGMVVFGACFTTGGEYAASKLHVNKWLVIIPLLVLYALSTSGVIYLPFGLEKTFPGQIYLK